MKNINVSKIINWISDKRITFKKEKFKSGMCSKWGAYLGRTLVILFVLFSVFNQKEVNAQTINGQWATICTRDGRTFYQEYGGFAYVATCSNNTWKGPLLVSTTYNACVYATTLGWGPTFTGMGSFSYNGSTYYYSSTEQWMGASNGDTSGLGRTNYYYNSSGGATSAMMIDVSKRCWHDNGIHDYTSKTTTSTYLRTAATCTTAATYYYKCSRCTAKGTGYYSSGSALGHNWQTATTSVNKGVRTAATCTAAATYYKKCSRCDTLDTNQYNAVGSALGHSWSSWSMNALTHSRTCTVCNASESGSHIDDNSDYYCDTCGYELLYTYTVAYYNGTTSLGTSSHKQNEEKTLTAFNGTAPSGWSFYGWATSTSATARTYTDGQSVTNIGTADSTVKLYAVFRSEKE